MPRKKNALKSLEDQPKISNEDDKKCNIVILFADVVGCSEISNHKTLKDYSIFIKSFQDCFTEVCKHYQKSEFTGLENFFDFETRGDEGCLKIFPPEGNLSENVDIALSIALDLKRKWLLEVENRKRIMDSGLLPIDIAIGIHSGKAWLKKDEKDNYKPEGYAINLAKRVESASRKGEFSHILISEAAYNHVNLLQNEKTYRFREPFKIEPKGISQNIKVFEVKHHFLPTDFQHNPSEASMYFDKITDDDVKLAKVAFESNPMNLWLAEEYILLSIMRISKKAENGESDKIIKSLYKSVLDVTQQVVYSDLRDAGILALCGFVYGEQENYADEQRMYTEGLEIDKLDGYLHWYLALSHSYELLNKMEDEGIDLNLNLEKFDIEKIKAFYDKNNEIIEKIFLGFERAIELEPMNPWIIYDYASEKSLWSLGVANDVVKKEYVDVAITNLINAYGFNDAIKLSANKEDYLKPIRKSERVKAILG